VLGVSYFTAPPKRGTFVKRENLTIFDPELEAAAKIQAGVRGTIAKKKAKQEVAWRTFNTLDADEESRLMQRRTKLLSSVLGARLNRERPDAAALERLERETEELPIDADYDGPHISWPLSEAQIFAMMDHFKNGRRLHLKYAMQIMSRYRRFAAALPTLIDVSIKPGTRLTVCGDTHGQLQDLFSIFTINGVPTPTNRYLMNGDFVDRGDYSCEILFTLMAFVLLYPSADPGSSAACLINRGNHESGNQNITGGFMMEVLDKYSSGSSRADAAAVDPERGMRIYDAFQSAFDVMPLVHVLAAGDRKVFVVHGGMMQRPGVTLAHIAAIKRKREIPYGLPGFEDKLFEDLMWR
jgi:hypothetical protein